MAADPAIAHHAALDARMAKAARGIRLLSLVSWPASEQQAFLAAHAAGNPVLPAYAYPKHDFSAARREMEDIAAASDPAHPLGIYLIESAHSWDLAAQLLEHLGTSRVTELSVALFGKPEHVLPGGATTREAANHFIAIANELDHELLAPSEQVEISATALALQLQAALDDYFDGRVITVVPDPDLIAVNLNEFVERAALHRQQVPVLSELKKVLRTSKTRRFVDVKTVNSAIRIKKDDTEAGLDVGRTVHCWVFEAPQRNHR